MNKQKILTLKTDDSVERNSLIDFLRGGAMILVLLHHSGVLFGRVIIAFHMPLFFAISGYLGNIRDGYHRPFKKFIARKFTRLIIPYFAFELVNLLIWCVKCTVEHQNLPGIEALWSILSCVNNSYMGMYGRLWFLPCMFVADIYVWLVVRYLKNNRFTYILSILFLFGMSFITDKIIPFRLPFTLDTAFFAAAFILLGYCFNDIIGILINKGNDVYKVILALVSLIYLLYSVKFTNVKVSMYINSYGEYTVSVCAAISGCLAFFIIGSYIYRGISKSRIIRAMVLWYGKNSLATFPVHLTIKMFIIWYAPALCAWYAMFAVMLFLNIPIVNAITNYAPFMLGQRYNKSENSQAA